MPKKKPEVNISEVLQQRWFHSHEEDTDTEMVFRPETYKFPRSRGRRWFDLQPNGKYIYGGIAPTDGTLESAGTWSLESDGPMVLHLSLPIQGLRDLAIESVNKDQLVLGKRNEAPTLGLASANPESPGPQNSKPEPNQRKRTGD